jgi:hypothetical protein
MHTYIYSKWHNPPAGLPFEFYSEMDSRRYETRKIEIFPNGKVGVASSKLSISGTQLGLVPVPELDEIRAQPEFSVKEISADEFERKWEEFAGRT